MTPDPSNSPTISIPPHLAKYGVLSPKPINIPALLSGAFSTLSDSAEFTVVVSFIT